MVSIPPTSARNSLIRRLMDWLEHVALWANREWPWITFLAWAIIAGAYLSQYGPQMHYMTLGDTDDNMRYLQVRDWLNGQSWWDLRQHRMDPPNGANIHWSRLVDLPIAALMLLLKPLVGAARSEQLALGIAPLLPMLPLMLALGFTTRRLGRPGALGWAIAIFLPLGAGMALSMYMPMRVDHHGWQLALTAIALAGVVDGNRLRGGLVAGCASALSVAIGMEMMVYLAGVGGLVALRWVFEAGGARRMVPYALALALTTALCFVFFTSNDNRQPVCDALSPVWTTVLILAAALLMLLARLPLKSWPVRLAAGAVAGAVLLGYTYAVWPQCLSGAYQISPELQRSWLAYIREAKSIRVEQPKVWFPLAAFPAAGLLCALAGIRAVRRDPDRLWAFVTVALMTLFAGGLLFWQIRAGPAAQLLAIPAMAWAGWALFASLWRGPVWRRALALPILAGLVSLFYVYPLYPGFASVLGLKDRKDRPVAVKTTGPAAPAQTKRKFSANVLCRTQPALAPLNQLPPATIFTMVDLGPRIIAMTHHSVIAGPYHRNGEDILDIHHAMDGTPEGFRPIAKAHGARYLLLCPGFPEGTIYQQRSVHGFYAQMMRGQIPKWLEPVTLKVGFTLPYSVYRIDYDAPDQPLRSAKNARSSADASVAPRPGNSSGR